jgi:hypothetical protein
MMKFRTASSIALTIAALTSAAFVAAAPGEQLVDAAVPLASIDAEGYSVVVKDGSGKVGEEAHIIVTVTAKQGYKVNDQYPHKLKLKHAPAGLEYLKPVMKASDAEIAKSKLTFRVPVKATKAGTFAIKGKLKLSVCNDQSCLIKKEVLSAAMKAK